jgi:hypothetical protein
VGALGLAAAARAIVIAGATGENDFKESMFSPIIDMGVAETFPGVGYYRSDGRICSGVLINPRSDISINPKHVLTAAHCFFQGSDGKNPRVPDPKEFILPEFAPKRFAVARVDLHPMYDATKGHRVAVGGPPREAFDLAIITLKKPIVGARSYPVTPGLLFPDERDPRLTTVKVGFGIAGNGMGIEKGFPRLVGMKRFMLNRVDQLGDGMTFWFGNILYEGTRLNPPPIGTLVYDFDNPADGILGSTNLRNAFNPLLSGAVPPVPINGIPIEFEGSPAGGDSGGPMFQRLSADQPWLVVGITSSISDPRARFGSVAYDTRIGLPEYQQFIADIVSRQP